MKKKQEQYDNKIKKRDKVIKKNIDIKWVIEVTIMSFIISLILSGGSSAILEDVNILVGLIIIVFFISIGVVFDMVGIAVASADEKPFHSMASKKVHTSKIAIKLIKNAEKVSAFCNDVIGDICNIMSGSAGAVVAVAIAARYHIDLVVTSLLVTAFIASITIGGKATGKSYAINKSEVIVYRFSKLIHRFIK